MPDTDKPDSRPSKVRGDRGPLERRRALTHIGAAVGGGAAALAGLDLLGSEPASAGTLNGPNVLNGPNTLDGTTQANTLKGTNLLQGTSGIGNVLSGRNTFGDVNTFTGDAYFASGRPWYDVRAFGAKGDGSTDDLGAINAAIGALAKNGGVLVFPPGRYLVSNTVEFSGISNFTIEMSGAQVVSQLRVAAGQQDGAYVEFNGCSDFVVRGGSISTSSPPTTRSWWAGIWVGDCTRFAFFGTEVAQGEGSGFYTTGLSTNGSFIGCIAQNTLADGFDTFSSGSGSPSQITYHGCHASNTRDDSYEVVTASGDPLISGVTFVGNTVSQSQSRGIVLAGVQHATVLGNVVVDTVAAGMSITCDRNNGTQGVNQAVFAGNVIDQSGSPDPNSTWPSIDISGNGGFPVTDVVVADNFLTNPRWRGIEVSGPPVSRVKIAGNRITGTPSFGIHVAGAQDVEIRNNAVYDSAYLAIGVDSTCTAPITTADNRVVNASTSRAENRVALDMEGLTGVRVTNNEVLDPNGNLLAGIDLTGANNVVLAGNTLDGRSVRPAASYAPAPMGSPLQLAADGQPGATIYTGPGAPTLSGKAGDLFIRTDAPSTAQQRLYMCVSGTNWSGIA